MFARFRIVSPDFDALVVLDDDRVVRSCPGLRFMIGWDVDRVLAHVVGRNWRLAPPGTGAPADEALAATRERSPRGVDVALPRAS